MQTFRQEVKEIAQILRFCHPLFFEGIVGTIKGMCGVGGIGGGRRRGGRRDGDGGGSWSVGGVLDAGIEEEQELEEELDAEGLGLEAEEDVLEICGGNQRKT